jgi:hypothetical protein
MPEVITLDNIIGTATGAYGPPVGPTELRPQLPPPISTRPTATESETSEIERDPDLYSRAVARLNEPGPTVPLSDVLNRLDDDQTGS